jgi:hypothetical protein
MIKASLAWKNVTVEGQASSIIERFNNDWVEDEVQKAFAEERERKQPILFPRRGLARSRRSA